MERSSIRDTPSSEAATAAVMAAYKLTEASNWWNDVNKSPLWQDRIFHLLTALYAVVAAIALVRTPSFSLFIFVNKFYISFLCSLSSFDFVPPQFRFLILILMLR